jgi:hypothetical protein
MADDNVVIYRVSTRREFNKLVNRYYIPNCVLHNGKRLVDGKTLYNLKTTATNFTVLSTYGVTITCMLVVENQ